MAEKETNVTKEGGQSRDDGISEEYRRRRQLLDSFNTNYGGQVTGAFPSGDTAGLSSYTVELSTRWGLGIYELPSPPVDSPSEENYTPSPPNVSPLEETAMPIPTATPSEETAMPPSPTASPTEETPLLPSTDSPLAEIIPSPTTVSVDTLPVTSSITDPPPNAEVVQTVEWKLLSIDEYEKGRVPRALASVPDTSVTEEAGSSETQVKRPISFGSCIASPTESGSEQSSASSSKEGASRPLLPRHPGKAELDEINTRAAKVSNSFSTAKFKLEGGRKFARLQPYVSVRPGPSNALRRGYQRLMSQVKQSKPSSSTASDSSTTGCFSTKRLLNSLKKLLPSWPRKQPDELDPAYRKFVKNEINRTLYELRKGPYKPPCVPEDLTFRPRGVVFPPPRRPVYVSSPEGSPGYFPQPPSTESSEDQQTPTEDVSDDEDEEEEEEEADAQQSRQTRPKRRF